MLDIEICWETDDRGDGEKFDRKGGTLASQVPQLYCILLYTAKLEVGEPDYTLAHALLPNGDRIFGNLHFDDVETWELPMLG